MFKKQLSPIERREEIKKEMATQIKECGLLAQICLKDETFRMYRERYAKLRMMLVEDMLECNEADPIKYALEMNTYAIKIKTLGLLLGSVLDDANASQKGDAA
jgi:hypothetical protein